MVAHIHRHTCGVLIDRASNTVTQLSCKRPTAARIAVTPKGRILNGYRSVLRTVYVLVTGPEQAGVLT